MRGCNVVVRKMASVAFRGRGRIGPGFSLDNTEATRLTSRVRVGQNKNFQKVKVTAWVVVVQSRFGF